MVGLEMLINTVLKSLNINPDMIFAKVAEVQQYVVKVCEHFNAQFKNTDARLSDLENTVARLCDLIEKSDSPIYIDTDINLDTQLIENKEQ